MPIAVIGRRPHGRMSVDCATGEVTAESPDRIAWVSGIPFLAFHLVPFAALFVSVTWRDWVLCASLYVVRMFFITAGYHRYFSHRSYRMGRVRQFMMALGGTTALQKGPLWWASHHRVHHRYTDLDSDVHSPRDGLWWSHVGWILSTRYKKADPDGLKDFDRFPELRFLDRFWWIGPLLVALGCTVVGGWGGLVVGFFLSTVLLWHATFLVNSMAHLIGRRRFATPDTSRNSMVIALLTGGEGWHNNHHYLPASARQGLIWWEFDPTWYMLRLLAALRLVRDLRSPPARLLDQARVRDGAFDIGMFRSYWERAAKTTGERIGDLTTHPVNAAYDGVGRQCDGGGTQADPAVDEHLSVLAGLISRALVSADQLAAATRRSRHETSDAASQVRPTRGR
ncbi:MAG: acyl-CoA desaturase [Acidimicrobiales bacterium]